MLVIPIENPSWYAGSPICCKFELTVWREICLALDKCSSAKLYAC